MYQQERKQRNMSASKTDLVRNIILMQTLFSNKEEQDGLLDVSHAVKFDLTYISGCF